MGVTIHFEGRLKSREISTLYLRTFEPLPNDSAGRSRRSQRLKRIWPGLETN